MAHQVHGELVPVGGGDPIPLIRESLTLGRLESCDICLRLPNVSKTHCRFEFHNGFWFVEDMGSTNGTKVNGVRVNKKLLHPDDTITIAKRTYTLHYDAPVGQHALEEIMEDDPMAQPLLEKAGLIRPRREDERRPGRKQRGDWMNVRLSEEDDDEE